MKDLSIIIISYNTAETTKICIQSVIKSLYDCDFSWEIVIIDNNSNDNSDEIIKKLQENNKNIIYKKNTYNCGFGCANNEGFQISNGNVILLLNSDTIVQENSISKMYECFKKNVENGFLGAKLYNADGSKQVSVASFYSIPIIILSLFFKGDSIGLTRSSPNKFCNVDWVSGACIMTNRKCYESLGGFDKSVFMYMEEVDLLYRAKKYGYHTFFCPEANIIHLGSVSSDGKSYPVLQVYRGFIYFYQKHHPFFVKILRFLLSLKAIICIIIGFIFNKKNLKKTYLEALQIALYYNHDFSKNYLDNMLK